MRDCTVVAVEMNSLVTTAITGILEGAVRFLDVVGIVLIVDADGFKFCHSLYLRYGVDFVLKPIIKGLRFLFALAPMVIGFSFQASIPLLC